MAFSKLNSLLEKRFPDRRIFLRSDTETRFIRLSPLAQVTALTGVTLTFSWTVLATAFLLIDNIGAGSVRDQSQREKVLYEDRLNTLSTERDQRAAESLAAQTRFNSALAEVSAMQSQLLRAQDRRRELETGIEVIQATLNTVLKDRDNARNEVANLSAELQGNTGSARTEASSIADVQNTLDFLSTALADTAGERDRIAGFAAAHENTVKDLMFEAQLVEQRNDRIFQQLEDAVTVSLKPLDEMFRAVGQDPDRLIESVRRGYSGLGGPLTPLLVPGADGTIDPDSMRANAILREMDRVNLYRIAAQKAPFAMPVTGNFRFTSGFGSRWGRMHNGSDFAGAHGTPIYATADGVVIHAGWQSGYGRLVKIQHDFGIETRYAHQSRLVVRAGERVTRGQKIGEMGNTGRSTGTHLHYEIRVGGTPVNPMNYIRAAQDVF
ncbi:M23 family metallopeptidase [Halocynthiibacter namhaensis]|uniref:M23 family metallopeptidase n=1 Tax=Halocynthiibacter namhaensis TaxID=1290553 RepID=UPI00057973AA|nr:M23 family metallopeptidase [Halocynthiibacter namhaensis]